MERVKCFMLEPTKTARRYLRRYTSVKYLLNEDGSYKVVNGNTAVIDRDRTKVCPGIPGDCPGHDAFIVIDEIPMTEEALAKGYTGWSSTTEVGKEDTRWPTKCDKCNYVFQPDDEWRIHVWQLHSGAPDGKQYTLRSAPPGAMWDAAWWPGKGPDGRVLTVMLPNGREWVIDGQASNCTRKNDKHFCWIRHGTPPEITVDKNGDTCAAGAGSIQAGDYHGFLRNGYLESC